MAQVESGFGDGFVATGATTDTSAYTVLGGRYNVVVNGSFNSQTVVLKILSPDGSNYVGVKDINGSAVSLTADGYATVDLPAGKVKFTFSGAATSVAAAVLPSPRREA